MDDSIRESALLPCSVFLFFIFSFCSSNAIETFTEVTQNPNGSEIQIRVLIDDNEEVPASFTLEVIYDHENITISSLEVASEFNSDGLGGSAIMRQTTGAILVSGWLDTSIREPARELFEFTAIRSPSQVPPITFRLPLTPENFVTTIAADGCSEVSLFPPPQVRFSNLGTIAGFAWIDVDNNQAPSQNGMSENLSVLGINGLTVDLFDNTGAEIDSMVTSPSTSGEKGYFEFSGLPAGTYRIVADDSEFPVEFPTYTTPMAYDIELRQGQSTNLFFGFLHDPTSIILSQFTAKVNEGSTIFNWQSEREENTLGYYLYQFTPTGMTQVVDHIILSQKQAGYSVTMEGVQSGIFFLSHLDTNLVESNLSVIIPGKDAPPQGDPAEIGVFPAQGSEWNVPPETKSYLLTEYNRAFDIIEYRDPYAPIVLSPAILERAGDNGQTSEAAYFSPRVDTTLRIDTPTGFSEALQSQSVVE